jgi:hypothetical protein
MRDQAAGTNWKFSMGFWDSEKDCPIPLDICEKVIILMLN